MRYRIEIWAETERAGVWRPLLKRDFTSTASGEQITHRGLDVMDAGGDDVSLDEPPHD